MADTETVVSALNRVLGDTYVLYAKTHSYHWNVTGANFSSLHTLFETQYTEMWQSLDDIAERIRALGAYAPTSTRLMAEASAIEETDNDVPSANTMLRNLVADHKIWVQGAEDALEIASDAADAGTEDLLTPLISAHEKMMWMLNSSIGD
ncbi:DNA starvation/stationary phase protection protein [Parvularcula sp. LCG005]|uniref:Dps family protein n=1 Tax=Parvularcula sp. LCG005 TaxID=3078805 RepID=UPI0029427C30|nr:DNA starvation/stationary phase protection protein [Parvularcula sp. LCG005]WOI52321.1 DNA starvation/stationary phase protection protein [Parvularcula sp. LCG005]